MANMLKSLREKAGWTQLDAAERMGVSRSHYVKLERSERGLTAHTIGLAARAFDVPMYEVLGETREALDKLVAENPQLFSELGFEIGAEARLTQRPGAPVAENVVALRNRLLPIYVVGKAEAGAFREIDDLVDQEHDAEVLFDDPDPDFPRAKRMAYTVQGDSMNAAEPPLLEGYRLICVEFEGASVPLSDGMTVIVQRTRDGGQTREWSIKEVEMGETEIRFCPRSTNPRHKPIVVPIDADPDDAGKVEVIAIARSVNASIPRYRIRRP